MEPLICCITDCCGGCNYFRTHAIALTEFRYSSLVDTSHGAKGTRNQVQLILDNKLRGFFAIRNTKQRRWLIIKRNLRKFIYSRDNKGRQMLINSLVNNMNR